MPTLIKILFLIDIGLCVVYLLLNMYFSPSDVVKELFDMNGEFNIPSFYSSFQLLSASILLAVFSVKKIKVNFDAILLITLPVILLFMALDETFMYHEILGSQLEPLLPGGTRKNTIFSSTGIWLFAYGLPFIFIFFYLINKIKPHIEGNHSHLKKLVLGMVILLTGALGVELLNNFANYRYWIFVISVEESLEMVGATIMVWASYDLANSISSIKSQ